MTYKLLSLYLIFSKFLNKKHLWATMNSFCSKERGLTVGATRVAMAADLDTWLAMEVD